MEKAKKISTEISRTDKKCFDTRNTLRSNKLKLLQVEHKLRTLELQMQSMEKNGRIFQTRN